MQTFGPVEVMFATKIIGSFPNDYGLSVDTNKTVLHFYSKSLII